MNVDAQIPEFILRLIGAFYCFGSIIGAGMITIAMGQWAFFRLKGWT